MTSAIALPPSRAHAAATLWYNGNYDQNDAYTDESNVPINMGGSYVLEKSLVYDDFIVPAGQTWTLASLFANDQTDYVAAPTTATWEIRTGMSAGNGGTLVASGDTSDTNTLETPGNGSTYTDPEYKLSVSISTVTLTPGIYWMALAPDSAGYYGDQSYVETTSGIGSVGLPTGLDGDSFLNNNLSGAGKLTFSPSSLDFSAGITGTATVSVVPEPADVPLLTAGLATGIGLLGRRKRSQCRWI
jgi:hypothetical protein